jgi:hypothetical protein
MENRYCLLVFEQRRGAGRISSGGTERDVQFLDPAGAVEEGIDGAYRDKYGASSSATQRIIAPLARETTIRITRANPETPANPD